MGLYKELLDGPSWLTKELKDNPNHPTNMYLTKGWQETADALDGPDQECFPSEAHVTDPSHGGKVVCHKCGSFIIYSDWVPYRDHQHLDEFPHIHFHKDCFNKYEHYYGLDKPID